MNAILPQDKAMNLCLKMMDMFDDCALGEKLRQKGHGRMFGVLVCTDGTSYRAFSGELEGRLRYPGFIPPVFDIEKYTEILNEYDELIKNSDTPKELSRECWNKLKKLYNFVCFDGMERNLEDIFPSAPSGTGDCCAPRLLSHAYKNGKKPESLCEFFYGDGSYGHKEFSTPCDSRCKPLLPALIGLDIVYQDQDIVVVNKPSGMLSIEGRGEDKQDCIASRVRNLFPESIEQPCIHRLDQATSGLLVLGLTKQAHDKLSRDFEDRKVYKEYDALVEGMILEEKGTIDLPIRLDVDNRPHQIVDQNQGKSAITEWTRLSIENRYGRKVTRLRLVPRTGRTHQLRVHCASGLNHPILGDALYGQTPDQTIPRLMLQARVLEFDHPTTKEHMRFALDADF